MFCGWMNIALVYRAPWGDQLEPELAGALEDRLRDGVVGVRRLSCLINGAGRLPVSPGRRAEPRTVRTCVCVNRCMLLTGGSNSTLPKAFGTVHRDGFWG